MPDRAAFDDFVDKYDLRVVEYGLHIHGVGDAEADR